MQPRSKTPPLVEDAVLSLGRRYQAWRETFFDTDGKKNTRKQDGLENVEMNTSKRRRRLLVESKGFPLMPLLIRVLDPLHRIRAAVRIAVESAVEVAVADGSRGWSAVHDRRERVTILAQMRRDGSVVSRLRRRWLHRLRRRHISPLLLLLLLLLKIVMQSGHLVA